MLIGAVAIALQYGAMRPLQAERGLDVPCRPTRVVQEADLVLSPTTGQKYAAFILPGPARPALISVSSIAITRERRTDSGWALKIGSTSDTAAGIGFVT
jgi:hypothetical protein